MGFNIIGQETRAQSAQDHNADAKGYRPRAPFLPMGMKEAREVSQLG